MTTDGTRGKGLATMAIDNDRALTLRLPAGLHDQLRERAEAEERTIAGLLRLAARHYLGATASPQHQSG